MHLRSSSAASIRLLHLTSHTCAALLLLGLATRSLAAQSCPGGAGSPGPYLNLAGLAQTTCKSGNWCSNLPAWGSSDPGACTGNGANIYFSTSLTAASDYPTGLLYIHHGTLMSQEPQHLGKPRLDGYHTISCTLRSQYTTPVAVTAPVTACYYINWVDPATNVYLAQWVGFLAAGAPFSPPPPPYPDDVLLMLVWEGPTNANQDCALPK